MSIEDKALEAVVAGEVSIPVDIYVGQNTEPQHIAEFFYRSHTQNLLGQDETPLAIFDCIILDREGRRLGGLTLHDYAVLTDQHLITWGRGLNKDIIDRFPLADIELDRFGRRNPLEGVIKFYYLMKPVGVKRKISLRSHGTTAGEVAATEPKPAGTAIYLDLMPAGEVQVCVEMLYFFLKANSGQPNADSFKEHFRPDITRSQARLGRVDFWMRPFYIDMGNGMLVEAGTLADPTGTIPAASPGNTPRQSPYRNEAPAARAQAPERPVPVPAAVRAPRPVAAQPRAVQPAAVVGQRITAPETVKSGTNYAVSGDVPIIESGGALNTGNRQTDTMRGTSRNNDTMRGSSGGGGRETPLVSTVSLNNSPYSGPSKLDSYEGRATGRVSTQSRLSGAGVRGSQPVARTRASTVSESVERMPPARPASVPRPGGAARENIPGSGAASVARMPRPTYVSPPRLPLNKTRNVSNDVLNEMAEQEAKALGRPLVVPIGLAFARGALNAYSISRLARGLWIDPRNFGRNVADLSQTLGVIGDVAELLTTDDEVRNTALRRLKIQANTTLGDNIIFHYTVWPFIKPVIDALNLPGRGGRRIGPARRRVSVRQIEDEMLEKAGTTGTDAAPNLADMGPMAGQDQAPVQSASRVSLRQPPAAERVPIINVPTLPTPPTPVEVKEISQAESNPVEPPLNTSGKGPVDPTAGQNLDDAGGTQPGGKSKLDDK